MKGYSRCAMCDEWYPPERARDHEHWHPQSGRIRLRWLASRLPWDSFADQDEEAATWDQEHRPAWMAPRATA